jgi:propionate CoA-transferase
MTLIEIAPGIDLENDILKQMEFRPKISDNLKTMDSGIFQEKWGRLEEIIKGK